MPLVMAFNLQRGDPAARIGQAVTDALASLPELRIERAEVDFVPLFNEAGDPDAIARINIDLWRRDYRPKDGLEELADRVARAFQSVVGQGRRVKVAIKPYAIEESGWVSR